MSMAGKPGALSEKPTQLPARYERLFAWQLDRRCKAVREVAGDMWELWQELGGVESLSAQRRWLAERIVFLRRRMLAYEAAVMAGTDPPMTAGEYSNFANVAQGHLRTLGLDRVARDLDVTPSTYVASVAKNIADAEANGNGLATPRTANPVPEATV
jgi:hypothetical protein